MRLLKVESAFFRVALVGEAKSQKLLPFIITQNTEKLGKRHRYLLLDKDSSRGSSLRPSLLLMSVRARFLSSNSTQRAAWDSAARWRAVMPEDSSTSLTKATGPRSPLTSDVAQLTESKMQLTRRSFVTIAVC